MFFTKFFLYSWLIFHKKRNIIYSNLKSVSELEITKEISFISKNKTDGKDYHLQPETEEEKNHIITKVNENIYKYNQLRLLENPNVSLINKMNIIDALEKDGIHSYNIENGGFWSDWE